MQSAVRRPEAPRVRGIHDDRHRGDAEADGDRERREHRGIPEKEGDDWSTPLA